MQAIMLYFSGSGIQIFSLGMIFMLVTGPITAIFNIFKGMGAPHRILATISSEMLLAFETFRPTAAHYGSSGEGKVVAEPSYSPLTLPMLAYIGCQALVSVSLRGHLHLIY